MALGLARTGFAVALGAAMLLAPALTAAASKTAKRGAGGQALAGSIGTFTPAAGDPRSAALLARSGLASGFRFTPAASPAGRRAVTVAVRAQRSKARTASAQPQRTVLAVAEQPFTFEPTTYNLGAAIGWKRFALSGDVTRIDTGVMPGGREQVDVNVAYVAPRWSTRLQLGSERSERVGNALVGGDSSYSVDLGGSYSVTSNLELNGGVRYKSQRDYLQQFANDRRDSQAVYIGTAFKF
jgi:hypothetical protein